MAGSEVNSPKTMDLTECTCRTPVPLGHYHLPTCPLFSWAEAPTSKPSVSKKLCVVHMTESRALDDLPCPWCTIDELRRNFTQARAMLQRCVTHGYSRDEINAFLGADIAAVEKSALPPVCVWTQLPDDPNPLELHKVQAKTACGGSVMGAYPFYPDSCIYCHKKIAWLAIGRSADKGTGSLT